MSEGGIFIPRWVVELLSNRPDYLVAVVRIAARVRWRPTRYTWGNTAVDLAPGEWVWSLRDLGAELGGWNRMTVKRMLDFLVENGVFVTRRVTGATSAPTVITVCFLADFIEEGRSASAQNVTETGQSRDSYRKRGKKDSCDDARGRARAGEEDRRRPPRASPPGRGEIIRPTFPGSEAAAKRLLDALSEAGWRIDPSKLEHAPWNILGQSVEKWLGMGASEAQILAAAKMALAKNAAIPRTPEYFTWAIVEVLSAASRPASAPVRASPKRSGAAAVDAFVASKPDYTRGLTPIPGQPGGYRF